MRDQAGDPTAISRPPPEALRELELRVGHAGARGEVRAEPRPAARRPRRLRWDRLATDSVALAASALLATLASVEGRSAALAGAGAATLLALALIWSRGGYDARALRGHAGLFDEARDVLAALSLAAMASVTACALALPGGPAAYGAARAWAAGAVLVTAGRALARLAARRSGRVPSGRALIVGAGRVGARLERRLRELPDLSLEPVGFLDSDPLPAEELPARHAPILGPIARLDEAIATTGATHVIVAFSSGSDRALIRVVDSCRAQGVEVWVVPRLFDSVNGRLAVDHVGGIPVTRFRPSARPGYLRVKAVFDRVAAAAAILLLLPVLAAIVAAVRLSSPGPVLFRQQRIGRDGVAFDMLKFRSMRLGPAETTAHDAALCLYEPTGPGGVEGADRRTRVGTFLRNSSLDELPQLFNILRGEMSFVGPRPERRQYVELFADSVERYTDRHRMKAGLTGWAQINGLRGQTSLARRVEWDNWYIDNWSLWLDLKILLMTATAARKGAG